MTSPTTRIAELASIISRDTTIVNQYFANNGIPSPSFAADGPLFDDRFPSTIEAARVAILDATVELHELIDGPRMLLQNIAHNFKVDSHLLHRQKLASKVPLDDPNGTTYTELAAQTGIDQATLTRVARQLILHRVFTEPTSGHFAH